MPRSTTALALALAVLAAGCATRSPDVISRHEAQRPSTVADATVLAVRPVSVDGSQTGVGAVAGGTVGAIAGASVRYPRDAAAWSLFGALAGAVIGNAIEYGATREPAHELLVQMRSGERRAIVQAIGSESFRPGDAVYLVSTDGRVRVTRASVAAAPQPLPAALPAPVPGVRG